MTEFRKIDLEAIENLKIAAGKNGPDLIQQLVVYFENSTPSIVQNMKLALDEKSFEKLGEYSHSLKSSCFNLGAEALGLSCKAIEESVFDKNVRDPNFYRDQIKKFEENYSETIREMHELVKTLEPLKDT